MRFQNKLLNGLKEYFQQSSDHFSSAPSLITSTNNTILDNRMNLIVSKKHIKEKDLKQWNKSIKKNKNKSRGHLMSSKNILTAWKSNPEFKENEKETRVRQYNPKSLIKGKKQNKEEFKYQKFTTEESNKTKRSPLLEIKLDDNKQIISK